MTLPPPTPRSDPRHARRGSYDDHGPLSPWRPLDACGTGFIAQRTGERSREVVALALEALARVAHRGAAATDSSGDGAGLLTQLPVELLRREGARGDRARGGRPVRGGDVLPPRRARGARGGARSWARCSPRTGCRCWGGATCRWTPRRSARRRAARGRTCARRWWGAPRPRRTTTRGSGCSSSRGALFAAGRAGDRFGVRNSGAVAVIEGAGNHCCEYMTGGIVALLSRAGRNFGAGMSNGVAYILEETGIMPSRVNHDSVLLAELDHTDDAVLRALVSAHLAATGSPHARPVLDGWDRLQPLFRRVEPRGAAAHVAAIRLAYLAARVQPVVAERAAAAAR